MPGRTRGKKHDSVYQRVRTKEIQDQAVRVPDRLDQQLYQIHRFRILENTLSPEQGLDFLIAVGNIRDNILQGRFMEVPYPGIDLIAAAGGRQHDQVIAFPCDFFPAPAPGMILMDPVPIRVGRQFDQALPVFPDLPGRDLFRLRIIVNGKDQIRTGLLVEFPVMVIQRVADGKLSVGVFGYPSGSLYRNPSSCFLQT